MKRLLLALALVATMMVVTGREPVFVPVPKRNDDGFRFDGRIAGNKAVPSVNPDPRVQWMPYPVAGYELCNADTCIVLPPNATLWIAKAVQDTAWAD